MGINDKGPGQIWVLKINNLLLDFEWLSRYNELHIKEKA